MDAPRMEIRESRTKRDSCKLLILRIELVSPGLSRRTDDKGGYTRITGDRGNFPERIGLAGLVTGANTL